MNYSLSCLTLALFNVDPDSTTRHYRSHHFTPLAQQMNNPYMYPDQAPWCEEHEDLIETRKLWRDSMGAPIPRRFDDIEEYFDAVFDAI